jgi:EAL domain-containing protein (putative c-di-GMP-specific phosphodiesterase class I)
MATTRPAVAQAATASPIDDDQARALVVEALHAGAPEVVAQPILGLASGHTVAYESLARFTHGGPSLAPDQWFGLAHRVGLGATLEARAVEMALRMGQSRPEGSLLSLNVSPSVLSSRELQHVLPADLSGLQVEVTETQAVHDLDRILATIEGFRRRGARIAIDDVGEGYASLQRVMSLAPDVLKLDRSLVTGVESERGKAAMVDAVVRYAARVGAMVCAEGVESLEDLYVLADLDVAEAQGWVIGMPEPLFAPASEPARSTCEASFAHALSPGGRTSDPGAAPTMEYVIGRLTNVNQLDELARLMVVVADVLDCDRVEISALDETGDWLEAIRRDSWRPDGVRYALADFRASRRVLATQEMHQVLASDPDADPAEVRWLVGDGFRSLVLVPVVSAGRPLGLLECCKAEERPWSRQQLRHARALASVMGPVLDTLGSVTTPGRATPQLAGVSSRIPHGAP